MPAEPVAHPIGVRWSPSMASMSRHRVAAITAAVTVLLLTTGITVRTPPSALGAVAPDQLEVALDSLSPVYLTPGRPVVVTGRITNPTGRRWSKLLVYLVIPPRPLTTRAGLNAALAEPTAPGNGQRIVDLDAIAEAEDLAPGQTTGFRLSVPYARLGVAATTGVYPVGIQVLATDDAGGRANQAIGRASTFVPALASTPTGRTAVTVVWPFTTAIRRGPDGRYAGQDDLVADVSPGGRLRRLLDLASSQPTAAATILLDPALLDALDDIATGSYGPPRSSQSTSTPTPGSTSTAESPAPEAADKAAGSTPARTFLDDLVRLARRQTTWALVYGDPDVLALTKKANLQPGTAVAQAADRATTATLARFRLEARRVFWPANGIASATTLARSATLRTRAAVLSPSVLPGWTDRSGTFLQVPGAVAPLPVLVHDEDLMVGGSAGASALELRQRVASEAVLASVAGPTPTGAPASVGVLVDPSWDPGPQWATAGFSALYAAPWVTAASADRSIGVRQRPWAGGVRLPPTLRPRAISGDQVGAAAALLRRENLLSQLLGASPARTAYYEQTAALSVSQHWRDEREAGTLTAVAQVRRLDARLGKVSVQATPYNTLPGRSGRFPITIRNGLSSPVTVGVHLESTNPSLRIDDVAPSRIGAGQSRTVTVTADVGDVSNSAVVARLTTSSGATFGTPMRFSVRSSAVGTVIWVALGAAGVLLAAALGRRFLRRRRTRIRLAGAAPADPRLSEDDR